MVRMRTNNMKLKDGRKIVGILSRNYAACRLILNKLSGVQYKDVRLFNWCIWSKPHLLLMRATHCYRSLEKLVAKLLYDFRAMWPTGCDVLHFFNCINHSSRSAWVVSVESGVPWSLLVTRATEEAEPDLSLVSNDTYVQARIKNLASPNCLALLPLSTCSYGIQMEIIKHFPQYAESIRAKTYTLHPPQRLIVGDIEGKGLTWDDGEEFHFIYVGRNFYRKGGVETLEALAALRSKYRHFRLTLISALTPDEDIYMRSQDVEKEVKKMIADYADWIDYYASLPNEQVLEKMKKAHVCLLPTWMDTYAYSVLESQACGTPLITTSLRALSEINGNEVGWLIDVPVNRLNNPLNQTQAQRDIFRSKLSAGLQEMCEYVLTHRQEVKDKSQRCLERIRKYHHPDAYARALNLIYAGRVAELICQKVV